MVAICPATGEGMARSLRSGTLPEFACDGRGDRRLAARRSTASDAVRAFGPQTALLLLHARGDESVPVEVSERLYAAAHEPKRLLALPGGHHRSVQHDAELQAVSVKFVERAATSCRR